MNRFIVTLMLAGMISACNDEKGSSSGADQNEGDTAMAAAPRIREEQATYRSDSATLNGFIAYDESKRGKLPVVLVVHEWWGLNDYPKMRARQLAELGYFAFAVDMFGNGKIANNPQEAQSLATPFYQDPALARQRLDAALAKAGEYDQADLSKAAAIGYCFGGTVVINSAKLGSDLKGVVSFHGGLEGPAPDKDLLKARMLICHGGSDPFVPDAQVTAFRKSMDSVGANYSFKVYPNSTHAFTNPNATEAGKKFNIPIAYNGAADTASWNDMKAFLSGLNP